MAVLRGAVAKIPATGFTNRYYQAYAYKGSRVLEYGAEQAGPLVEVTWAQTATVSPSGVLWVVDRDRHQVVTVPPHARDVSFAAYYEPYAGVRGKSGFYNGERTLALFNAPSGIAYADNADIGKPMVYVADTNNHCIRALDLTSQRTSTVAGTNREMGLRDGPSSQARFRYPISLGIDSSGKNLFVLDGRVLRRVDLTVRPAMTTTIVEGACRHLDRWVITATVYLRKVACHADWELKDTGVDIPVYRTETMCRGHTATCGPRHHPVLADRASEHLRYKDGEVPSI